MPPETQTPTVTQPVAPSPLRRRLRLPGGWMTVALVLLLVIAAIVWLWKPWDAAPKAGDRTVTVRGTATVKAEPDEFVFYPYYDVDNPNQQTAIKQLADKSNQIVAELKKLGVADKDIKVDSSGYSGDTLYRPEEPDNNVYSLYITIFVYKKDLAQKVQDYLLTTSPSGAITPEGTFSEAKQKQLEADARGKAERDARARADQSAKNLGFKVGKVKTLEDTGFQDYYGFISGGAQALTAEDTAQSSRLILQPGEDELSYFVQVTYYIR